MTLSYRRLAFTTAATIALAAGVGATPALAAQWPITAAIQQQLPKIQETQGSTGSRARDERTIAGLQANTKACKAAIAAVAPVPATEPGAAQAKRDWLTGVRMQIVGNDQLVAGIRDVLSGHGAVGRVLEAESYASLLRADDDTSQGEMRLGLG